MQRDTDLEQVNQFVLHKQHLARNSRAESGHLVDVVKDLCGLHAQVASTPYLSLWNRVTDFEKEDLSRQLYEKRTLVKIWSIRATVHIVPTDHVVEYYQATRKIGRRNLFKPGPVHRKIIETLDKRGPLTTQELAGHIFELKERIQTPYGEMSMGQLRLRELSQATILVPVKPKGDWKSSLHTYANFKTWLPNVDLEALNEQEAQKKIISRYLSGFGPAAVEDIAWWIGIAQGEIKKNLNGMRDTIEQINIRGLDGAFLILKSDGDRLRRVSPGNDTVHLLPKFDPYIMGYKKRQRLIPAEHEKKAYWSTRAEVSPAILVNGRIVGTWNHKEENDRITIALSLFEKANKSLGNTIKQQAGKLARFISGKDPDIVFQHDS